MTLEESNRNISKFRKQYFFYFLIYFLKIDLFNLKKMLKKKKKWKMNLISKNK